jgi:hypothetical protein
MGLQLPVALNNPRSSNSTIRKPRALQEMAPRGILPSELEEGLPLYLGRIRSNRLLWRFRMTEFQSYLIRKHLPQHTLTQRSVYRGSATSCPTQKPSLLTDNINQNPSQQPQKLKRTSSPIADKTTRDEGFQDGDVPFSTAFLSPSVPLYRLQTVTT